MVDRVTIDTSTENTGPSLEEEAREMGLTDEAPQESSDSEPSSSSPPEGVPAKFWNAESGEVNVDALLKSYTELEKAKGTNEETESSPQDEAEEIIQKAGLDFDDLQAEYDSNGELSTDSYKSLEDAGIPKALVNQYIEGQAALADATTSAIYTSVGGKETYDSMISWAQDTLEPSEISTFNDAVTSGQKDQMILAVKGLQARFQSNGSFEPNASLEGANASTQGNAYRSVSELLTDMNDDRYRKDPAFRSDVETKLSRSNIM